MGIFGILTQKVDDWLLGAILITISLGFFLWSFAAVFTGYNDTDKERMAFPRWHYRRIIPYTFDFWLGSTLMLIVVGLYAYLGFVVLYDGEGTSVAWLLYFLVALGCFSAAMRHWARDRIVEGRAHWHVDEYPELS